jgi:Holliday junction resolvasome RuvABC endonuclease subunit
MSTDTILGIDPGTRFVGIAVMRGSGLVHYQIRAFQGPWSLEKLEKIVLWVDANISKYGVTKVAIKIPDVFPLSPGYNQLIGSLNVFCSSKNIKPAYYTASEIKSRLSKAEIQTTDELMQILVLKHPELWLEYRKEQGNENAHYHKLFHSVAVAHLA